MITFDRARNGDGQFAPEASDGGIDPATMRAAYGPAKLQSDAGSDQGGADATDSAAQILAQRLKARGFTAMTQ